MTKTKHSNINSKHDKRKWQNRTRHNKTKWWYHHQIKKTKNVHGVGRGVGAAVGFCVGTGVGSGVNRPTVGCGDGWMVTGSSHWHGSSGATLAALWMMLHSSRVNMSARPILSKSWHNSPPIDPAPIATFPFEQTVQNTFGSPFVSSSASTKFDVVVVATTTTARITAARVVRRVFDNDRDVVVFMVNLLIVWLWLNVCVCVCVCASEWSVLLVLMMVEKKLKKKRQQPGVKEG